MTILRLLATVALGATLVLAPFPTPAQVHAREDEGDTSNWIDNDYEGCVEGAFEQDRVCAPAFASHMQTNFMKDFIRKMAGPVPTVTTTGDVWQRNPKYAQRLLQDSAIVRVNGLIVAMYATPPTDLALWGRDIGYSLGFLPRTAQAQGVGFSGLQALLPVWKAFRNIAYFLLALVMIVIGFMVMLRKKIDPKTVVTVQNALPRIVITLLLITFSYAIVGIMIELMYVVILVAVGVLEQSQLLRPVESTFGSFAASYGSNQALYSQGGLFAAIGNSFRSGVFGIGGDHTDVISIVHKILGVDTNRWRAIEIFGLLGTATSLMSLNYVGAAFSATVFAGPTLIALLVYAALLFLIIRLFVFFLGAYIQIIVALIFAPIQLLGEALPGSSSFSSWFKNLIANIIVFPVGAIIFMLSNVFAYVSTQSGSLWTPPFVPLLGANISSIGALLSLGILFAIPSIAGGIKESLKTKPFVPAGPEGIVGSFSQPVGLAMQIYQMVHSHQSVDYMKKLYMKQGGE